MYKYLHFCMRARNYTIVHVYIYFTWEGKPLEMYGTEFACCSAELFGGFSFSQGLVMDGVWVELIWCRSGAQDVQQVLKFWGTRRTQITPES
jgi:hypothetical protein